MARSPWRESLVNSVLLARLARGPGLSVRYRVLCTRS